MQSLAPIQSLLTPLMSSRISQIFSHLILQPSLPSGYQTRFSVRLGCLPSLSTSRVLDFGTNACSFFKFARVIQACPLCPSLPALFRLVRLLQAFLPLQTEAGQHITELARLHYISLLERTSLFPNNSWSWWLILPSRPGQFGIFQVDSFMFLSFLP